jgi:multicomponent Na+:H+ antiporter subunit E
MLLLNVCLAGAWAAVTGELSVSNLITGFVVAYFILWIISQPTGNTRYFTKVGQVLRFAAYFLWELLIATLRVAIDIVTPKHLMKPAILAIPVNTHSAGETTMLANAITLTPGTLTLDVSPDGRTLYVHAMYASDIESARRAIQNGFGRRVHEVFE